MSSVVLIVGGPDDAHAAAVAAKVTSRGAAAVFLDFNDFPAEATLAWDPIERRGALELASGRLDLAAVRSVYWRTARATRAARGLEERLHRFAEQETRRALESLLQGLGVPVINPATAIAAHRFKPVQSATVAGLGVAVPETVITSDPAAAAAMFHAHPEGVIIKPVGGGAYARRMTRRDLERTDSIRACPMQLQRWIAGEDVRVYVVGDVVCAGRILLKDPGHVDFRTDPTHVSEAVALSDAEARLCRRIARALGLVWTGIDFRRTPAGDLVFLEANPSPMFLRFERDTGLAIGDALADLLVTCGDEALSAGRGSCMRDV